MTKIDMTQESEAAQDNALLSLLVTACQTDGWVVFTHNNGETVDVIAGLLTDELRIKIADAIRRTDASRGLMRYCGVCGYDVALAPDDRCADCGGVTHDTRADYEAWAAQHAVKDAPIAPALMGIPAPTYDNDDSDEPAPRDDVDWTEPPFGMPTGFDATPPETYDEADIVGPKWTDEDERQFAEYEAREAERQRAHDADIDSRGYEPYGEGDE
jgi:hypothetical protein